MRAAIESGGIDVVFAAGKIDAPLIDGLLRAPGLTPVSLRRIDAITFRGYSHYPRPRRTRGTYPRPRPDGPHGTPARRRACRRPFAPR